VKTRGWLFLLTCLLGSFGALDVNAAVEGPYSVSEPWAGWWWPWYTRVSTHLYDTTGTLQPMSRYDTYFNQPGSAYNWEYSNHRTTDSASSWYGHCDAWSAASYLEREPSADRTPFKMGDLEGLLTETYMERSFDRYYDNMTPGDFWLALRKIKNERHVVIMDLYQGSGSGDQVWNYPVYWYQLTYTLRSGSTYDCVFDIRVEDDSYRPDGTSHHSISLRYYGSVQMSGGNPLLERAVGGLHFRIPSAHHRI